MNIYRTSVAAGSMLMLALAMSEPAGSTVRPALDLTALPRAPEAPLVVPRPDQVATEATQADARRGKAERVAYREVGNASWYGPGFHGRLTASGDRYDQNDLTAAHRKLPLGSEVTVTNLENGRKVTVQINDRGPYVQGRQIDLSRAAAKRLGMVEDGVVRVRIEATRDQLATVQTIGFDPAG